MRAASSGIDAAGHAFVAGHLQTDDEVRCRRSARIASRDLAHETDAVLQRAAVRSVRRFDHGDRIWVMR